MSGSDQAYLNTRVTLLSLQLMSPETMTALARLPLAALAERLGMEALLDDASRVTVRRRVLEQALLQTLLNEMSLLARPMIPMHRDLVRAWARKFALSNLKTLIRGKLYALDPQELHAHLFELPEALRLPEELPRAENVPELLRQLESGPYHVIARQAREVYEQHREPFLIEAAIDQRYYAEIQRRIMGLDTHHQDALRRLIGSELDCVALLWLVRYRFSYRLSPSETYYRLVPSPRYLGRERLLELVNLDSLEQVLAALPAPLATAVQGCTTLAETQQRLATYTLEERRWVLHQSQSAIARALAYLMLRESNLFVLFAIAQGRLLNCSDTLIEQALELVEPQAAPLERRAA